MRTVIFFYVAALVLLVIAALFIAQNNRDYLTSIITQFDDEKVGANLNTKFTKPFSCKSHNVVQHFSHAKRSGMCNDFSIL